MNNRLWGGATGREVPDSRRFMPLDLGDNVSGEGNWEIIDGVRFFSCHTFGVARALVTRNTSNQPDYMIFDEVEWDVAGFNNRRARVLLIGFTTLEDSQVDVFSLHMDPATNTEQEFPLGTTVGNLDTIFQGLPPNAGHIFKIRHDIDFDLGAPVIPALSACQNLLNGGFAVCPQGGTMEEEFSIISPICRDLMGRSRHSAQVTAGNEPLDILGRVTQYGQYLNPVGVGHPEFGEVNLDKLADPFIFSGVPWNLDRRLGPGGCLDADGAGLCSPADPVGGLVLDPFPFSTLDPRTQANPPVFAADRIFSFFPFATADVMSWPPATPDPAALTFAFAAAPGSRCTIPNDLPVAQNDGAGGTIATDEDTALLIAPATLLANDLDPDGDLLTIYATDAASTQGGLVELQVDQSILFTPAPDFNGTDSFAYFVSDSHGGTAIALVTVTVLPVNDAPIATADDLLTAVNTSRTLLAAELLANDSDIEGDTLSVTSIDATGSAGGTMTPGAGDWTYTPPTGLLGLETFNYSITDGNGGTATAQLRIHVGNNPPTATSDSVATNEDTSLSITALANDTDPDLDPLAITGFSQGSIGSVSQLSASTLLFTPDPNANGTDSFTYSITDGRGGNSSATVTVAIAPVNDPPVAVADLRTTLEDTPVDIAVLANDHDVEGQALTLLSVSLPFSGTTTIIGGSTVRYIPTPDLALILPDNFTYTIADASGATAVGTVSVVVTPVNDAPVGFPDTALTVEDQPVTINPLLNDFDVENDTLRIQSINVPPGFPAAVTFDPLGSVTMVPDPNFNNSAGDAFTYTVTDGRASATAIITMVVLPVNDPPVANDDLGNVTLEDTPLLINVLANDSDVDGNPITIVSTTTPLRGTVSVAAGGALLYTPNPNAFGNDVFQYTITDFVGGVDAATVALSITPVNDAPSAGNDGPVPLAEDTVKVITLALMLANDLDVDGDPLAVISVSAPLHGTASLIIGGGGTVTGVQYVPNANFSGTDAFTYTVEDPSGASDFAIVTLQILPVNDPPVAQNDFLVLDQDTSATAAVLANDTDVDGNPLTISAILAGALNGSAVVNAGGTITYTPIAGFFGIDHVVYQVSDGNGGTDSASLDIAILQVITPSSAFIRGDANTDGSLNVADPIQTLVVLFQSATPICLVSHDANDDDGVDVGDIIFSLNYIFSSGQQPGAPFLFCGEDPTTGTLACESFGLCQ